MKDSRFIELLNLYVDQQLTTPEAAELESEILKNPERRRTYQQYCRMQNACTRLFESERDHAPASLALTRALAEADRKIVAFPNRRPLWSRRVSFAGLAAVAACAVFVAVPRQRQYTPGTVSSTLAQPIELVSLRTSTPAAPAQNTGTARPEFYSVFTPRQLSRATEGGEQEPALDVSVDRVNLDWMRRVDLQPVRPVFSDQFAFEPQPTVPRETSPLTSRRPLQNNSLEKTVFMFSR